jgi:hypothetical protein
MEVFGRTLDARDASLDSGQHGFGIMNTKIRTFSTLALIALLGWSAPALAQQLGNPDCSHLMLVSSYTGNNVGIYDACDGSRVRNLDINGYLKGAQAIALDPQGRLVVVSENNGRLVRYHRSSLTYDAVIAGDRPETAAIEPIAVIAPTGLSIAADGRMFVGSYSGQTVSEVDPASGKVTQTIVSSARSGIKGPDTGMILDGNRLLVPGFDSSTVVEADITKSASDKVLVPAGTAGMNAPRTILKMSTGNLLVTSWRGNAILEFNGGTGAFVRTVSTGIQRPTGMAFESEDVLLVASDRSNNVRRVRISDGQVLDTVINYVDSPTFILLLEKQSSSLVQNNSFWIIGVGEIVGKSVYIDEMSMTTGGQFGSAFNPGAVDNQTWGGLTIEFDSCDGGQVSWNPSEGDFQAGAYAIVRLAADAFDAECKETGFDLIDHDLWMNGLWYGGPDRDGEGFSVNVIDGGLAVVTWYTYRPELSQATH